MQPWNKQTRRFKLYVTVHKYNMEIRWHNEKHKLIFIRPAAKLKTQYTERWNMMHSVYYILLAFWKLCHCFRNKICNVTLKMFKDCSNLAERSSSPEQIAIAYTPAHIWETAWKSKIEIRILNALLSFLLSLVPRKKRTTSCEHVSLVCYMIVKSMLM